MIKRAKLAEKAKTSRMIDFQIGQRGQIVQKDTKGPIVQTGYYGQFGQDGQYGQHGQNYLN